MADELTDAQIALLCEIGELKLSGFTPDQQRDLDRLVSSGFVEPSARYSQIGVHAYGQGG